MRANGSSSALVSTVGGPEVKPALCLLSVGEEVIYHQNSSSASNSVSFRCVSRGPLDKRLHENVHQGINKRLQERAFIKELTRDFRRTFIKDLLGYINILLDKYRCIQDEILKRQSEF